MKLKKKKNGVKKSAKKKGGGSKFKWFRDKCLWKKIVIILLILAIFMILAFTAFCAYIVLTTDDFVPDKLSQSESTIMYDNKGNEFTTLGVMTDDILQKREKISYDEFPQVLVDALIATEDSRFFQHNGVDLARFLKASALQLLGRDAGGASTLTMQVSKNNFTDTTSHGIKGIIRKFRDIYVSVFQIEKNYTKQEIIEFYLNDNCMGETNYGVEQGSQYYFGKSARDLSLTEAALLVGLFQSPNGYNPYVYPEKAETRRNTVLNLMVRHGYITKEEADIAKSIPVESLLSGDGGKELDQYYGFSRTVYEEAIKLTGLDPYVTPMKIYTTLNIDVQDGINKALAGETVKWKDDVVQAGIAVTDVNTGAVIAIGAGRNRTTSQSFNFATQARRQPGSTAKPLFDYAPGIEFENWSTYQLFTDEKWSYTNGPEVNNWDNKYSGLMTMKSALAVSRNIPALKAFQSLNKSKILEFVTSLGIEPEVENGFLHEAHAIGGFTGVSPLQMAVAYASFANGGYYIEPYTITKIEIRSTGEVFEYKHQKNRVMSEATAYLMNNMLVYAVNNGFNGGAKLSGVQVAAKTGTSNYSKEYVKEKGLSSSINDLWTVAYTPEHSIALWYGYERASKEYQHSRTGYNTQKENIMRAVMKYIPKTSKTFKVPGTVVSVDVEKGTWPAMLPSAYTPSDLITKEVFIKGTEPTEVSPRFAQFDNVTNIRYDYSISSGKIRLNWDYQEPKILTDAYLNNYFSQSVFGNSTSVFVSERKLYNDSVLGEFGFGIYKKDASGNLTALDFVTDNNYTYVVPSGTNGTITLVVKAEYYKFKSNSSTGVEVPVAISNTPGTTVTPAGLAVKFYGDSVKSKVININVGSTFVEQDKPIVITYNDVDVTDDATISVVVKHGTSTTKVTSGNPISKLINTSSSGTYRVEYSVKYNDYVDKFTLTINVK